MRVKLLAHTPKPDVVVGVATAACWSREGASEILKKAGEGKLSAGLKKAVERGHTSVMEHATFTFSIEGVSRACTHQLVRHRMASYSQQSQRHVKMGGGYIVPPSIAENREAKKLYGEVVNTALDGYRKLLKAGIPTEDARFLLPNAMGTNLVLTMNARSLLNFFELRCCTHAQWEIRRLANEMLRQVRKVAPKLFERAGPPCQTKGTCPEGDWACYSEYLLRRGTKIKPRVSSDRLRVLSQNLISEVSHNR